MPEIYFLIRFTPFWSIPVLMIAGEFTYKMWLRRKRKTMLFFAALTTISFICTCMYIYAGGPEKSVQMTKRIVWFYTR